MPAKSGRIPVEDGLSLFYEVAGEGADPLVVSDGCWLKEDLLPFAQDRQVIFFDHRGRGRSDRDPNPASLWTDYQVRDLEAIRQFFGLEGMSLLGWSAQGGTAALYAAQYPQHVNRLVLMCPLEPRKPAPYDDPAGAEQREQARIDPAGLQLLREKIAAGEHLSHPVDFFHLFHRVLTPRLMARPEALAGMKSDPSSLPNEWWHNLREHNQLHAPEESRTLYDWRERIRSISAPTLVVHGAEDLIPLAAAQEWTDNLSQAKLVVVPGAGHYPHLENPHVFFAAVRQFLADR